MQEVWLIDLNPLQKIIYFPKQDITAAVIGNKITLGSGKVHSESAQIQKHELSDLKFSDFLNFYTRVQYKPEVSDSFFEDLLDEYGSNSKKFWVVCNYKKRSNRYGPFCLMHAYMLDVVEREQNMKDHGRDMGATITPTLNQSLCIRCSTGKFV